MFLLERKVKSPTNKTIQHSELLVKPRVFNIVKPVLYRSRKGKSTYFFTLQNEKSVGDVISTKKLGPVSYRYTLIRTVPTATKYFTNFRISTGHYIFTTNGN